MKKAHSAGYSRLRHPALAGIEGVAIETVETAVRAIAPRLEYLALSLYRLSMRVGRAQLYSIAARMDASEHEIANACRSILSACTVALQELAVEDDFLTLDTLRGLPPLRKLHLAVSTVHADILGILRAFGDDEIAETVDYLEIQWNYVQASDAQAAELARFSGRMAQRGVEVQIVSMTGARGALAFAAAHHFGQQLPDVLQAPANWSEYEAHFS